MPRYPSADYLFHVGERNVCITMLVRLAISVCLCCKRYSVTAIKHPFSFPFHLQKNKYQIKG